jgi:hypothetical protein
MPRRRNGWLRNNLEPAPNQPPVREPAEPAEPADPTDPRAQKHDGDENPSPGIHLSHTAWTAPGPISR